MVNKIIGYVRLRQHDEGDAIGHLSYEFTNILSEEIEKEGNEDLRELVIENISNLEDIFVELIKRSEGQ